MARDRAGEKSENKQRQKEITSNEEEEEEEKKTTNKTELCDGKKDWLYFCYECEMGALAQCRSENKPKEKKRRWKKVEERNPIRVSLTNFYLSRCFVDAQNDKTMMRKNIIEANKKSWLRSPCVSLGTFRFEIMSLFVFAAMCGALGFPHFFTFFFFFFGFWN